MLWKGRGISMEKSDIYQEILKSLKESKRYKIVFIGDSITSGEWVQPNWRNIFEYILKFSFTEFDDDDWWIPEWNLKFYNYSLDGASSREFLDSVKLAMKEVDADLYIIMGTANDVELGIPLEEHIANIAEIFRMVGEQGKRIIFSPDIYSGSYDLNMKYLPFVQAVMDIPSQEGVKVFNGYDLFSKFELSNFYTLEFGERDNLLGESKIDPVHPNALGNAYIAKMFLEEGFGIEVDPDLYITDLRSDTVKYPRW